MKTILLPIVLSFLLITSCSDKNKVEELQKEIISLKAENDSLNKLIQKQNLETLTNTQLYLIPNKLSLAVGKPNTIEGVFSEIQEYPDFELYYADQSNNYNESNKINFRKTDKTGLSLIISQLSEMGNRKSEW